MVTQENIEIGKRLRIFGEKNFSSMAEFAEAMGIRPQNLNELLNGIRNPGKKTLDRLEKIGCNRQWLLFGTVTYPLPPGSPVIKDKNSIHYSMPGHITERERDRIQEFINALAEAPEGDREKALDVINIILKK